MYIENIKKSIWRENVVDFGDLLILEDETYCLIIDVSLFDEICDYGVINLSDNSLDGIYSSVENFKVGECPFSTINEKIKEIIKAENFKMVLSQ